MTVQAVITTDRRFVRLTVVPFFSKITAVNTFQFTGTTTTTVRHDAVRAVPATPPIRPSCGTIKATTRP